MTFTPLGPGLTVSGPLTVTGLLSTQAGIANSGAQITNSQNYTGSGVASILVPGNVDVALSGDGFKTAEGSNAKQGIATLAAGTVTVANTSVTANSRILPAGQAAGGTPGGVNVSGRTPGTSFTLTSTNAADTSVCAYEIFEPG